MASRPKTRARLQGALASRKDKRTSYPLPATHQEAPRNRFWGLFLSLSIKTIYMPFLARKSAFPCSSRGEGSPSNRGTYIFGYYDRVAGRKGEPSRLPFLFSATDPVTCCPAAPHGLGSTLPPPSWHPSSPHPGRTVPFSASASDIRAGAIFGF